MQITVLSQREFDNYLGSAKISYSYLETPAGLLEILATEKGIFKTNFVAQPQELPGYTRVKRINCDSFLLKGTEFQVNVWRALLKIPAGKTVNYAQIAGVIGQPTAFRAVANAVGDNPIAYLIPCHRVIRKSGDLCGYNWGVERKELLLKAEGVTVLKK